LPGQAEAIKKLKKQVMLPVAIRATEKAIYAILKKVKAGESIAEMPHLNLKKP
jgi:hypothetical protein